MIQNAELHLLQKALGYSYNNIEYLRTALIHSSYANEMRSKGEIVESNERLEFLGDAVLETVISEHLYNRYEKRREGALTKMRQQLVCEKTLAKIASEIGLGQYIMIGKGEEGTDLRKRPKVLADCLEAVIASIYLDMGKGTGVDFSDLIIRLFEKKISQVENSQATDYKTMLQQFSEQDATVVLKYITEQSGEPHSPSFLTVAYVNNNAVGEGAARTKKESEMLAAKQALKLFGIIE